MYNSIDEIKQANARLGHHWFERSTLRFFSSRVGSDLYGGRYFVTSEKPPGGTRAYAVRVALPDGEIESVTPVCAFATRREAHALARKLGDVKPYIRVKPEEGSETIDVLADVPGESEPVQIFWTYDADKALDFCAEG